MFVIRLFSLSRGITTHDRFSYSKRMSSTISTDTGCYIWPLLKLPQRRTVKYIHAGKIQHKVETRGTLQLVKSRENISYLNFSMRQKTGNQHHDSYVHVQMDNDHRQTRPTGFDTRSYSCLPTKPKFSSEESGDPNSP